MINSIVSNAYQQQKQTFIKQRYNEIYAHEQSHKNAAGSLGGSIVIEKNAQGIPVGGHVDIKMPSLDKNHPEKTIEHADRVIKSAMAPDSPSSQDYKVAAEAKSIKSEAQSEKANNKEGHKLDIFA